MRFGWRLPRFALTVNAAAAVLVLDVVTPLGFADWLLQIALVWIATLWANRRQILIVAAICASFTILGFWLSPRTRPVTWIDQSNLLLSLGVIAALTHTSLRRRAADDARRQAAQALSDAQATVRVLSGLLPICAWCKRIRNDTGGWEQLEIYIRNHSQADFTHGMCQECAARVALEDNGQ